MAKGRTIILQPQPFLKIEQLIRDVALLLLLLYSFLVVPVYPLDENNNVRTVEHIVAARHGSPTSTSHEISQASVEEVVAAVRTHEAQELSNQLQPPAVICDGDGGDAISTDSKSNKNNNCGHNINESPSTTTTSQETEANTGGIVAQALVGSQSNNGVSSHHRRGKSDLTLAAQTLYDIRGFHSELRPQLNHPPNTFNSHGAQQQQQHHHHQHQQQQQQYNQQPRNPGPVSHSNSFTYFHDSHQQQQRPQQELLRQVPIHNNESPPPPPPASHHNNNNNVGEFHNSALIVPSFFQPQALTQNHQEVYNNGNNNNNIFGQHLRQPHAISQLPPHNNNNHNHKPQLVNHHHQAQRTEFRPSQIDPSLNNVPVLQATTESTLGFKPLQSPEPTTLPPPLKTNQVTTSQPESFVYVYEDVDYSDDLNSQNAHNFSRDQTRNNQLYEQQQQQQNYPSSDLQIKTNQVTAVLLGGGQSTNSEEQPVRLEPFRNRDHDNNAFPQYFHNHQNHHESERIQDPHFNVYVPALPAGPKVDIVPSSERKPPPDQSNAIPPALTGPPAKRPTKTDYHLNNDFAPAIGSKLPNEFRRPSIYHEPNPFDIRKPPVVEDVSTENTFGHKASGRQRGEKSLPVRYTTLPPSPSPAPRQPFIQQLGDYEDDDYAILNEPELTQRTPSSAPDFQLDHHVREFPRTRRPTTFTSPAPAKNSKNPERIFDPFRPQTPLVFDSAPFLDDYSDLRNVSELTPTQEVNTVLTSTAEPTGPPSRVRTRFPGFRATSTPSSSRRGSLGTTTITTTERTTVPPARKSSQLIRGKIIRPFVSSTPALPTVGQQLDEQDEHDPPHVRTQAPRVRSKPSFRVTTRQPSVNQDEIILTTFPPFGSVETKTLTTTTAATRGELITEVPFRGNHRPQEVEVTTRKFNSNEFEPQQELRAHPEKPRGRPRSKGKGKSGGKSGKPLYYAGKMLEKEGGVYAGYKIPKYHVYGAPIPLISASRAFERPQGPFTRKHGSSSNRVVPPLAPSSAVPVLPTQTDDEINVREVTGGRGQAKFHSRTAEGETESQIQSAASTPAPSAPQAPQRNRIHVRKRRPGGPKGTTVKPAVNHQPRPLKIQEPSEEAPQVEVKNITPPRRREKIKSGAKFVAPRRLITTRRPTSSAPTTETPSSTTPRTPNFVRRTRPPRLFRAGQNAQSASSPHQAVRHPPTGRAANGGNNEGSSRHGPVSFSSTTTTSTEATTVAPITTTTAVYQELLSTPKATEVPEKFSSRYRGETAPFTVTKSPFTVSKSRPNFKPSKSSRRPPKATAPPRRESSREQVSTATPPAEDSIPPSVRLRPEDVIINRKPARVIPPDSVSLRLKKKRNQLIGARKKLRVHAIKSSESEEEYVGANSQKRDITNAVQDTSQEGQDSENGGPDEDAEDEWEQEQEDRKLKDVVDSEETAAILGLAKPGGDNTEEGVVADVETSPPSFTPEYGSRAAISATLTTSLKSSESNSYEVVATEAPATGRSTFAVSLPEGSTEQFSSSNKRPTTLRTPMMLLAATQIPRLPLEAFFPVVTANRTKAYYKQ